MIGRYDFLPGRIARRSARHTSGMAVASADAEGAHEVMFGHVVDLRAVCSGVEQQPLLIEILAGSREQYIHLE